MMEESAAKTSKYFLCWTNDIIILYIMPIPSLSLFWAFSKNMKSWKCKFQKKNWLCVIYLSFNLIFYYIMLVRYCNHMYSGGDMHGLIFPIHFKLMQNFRFWCPHKKCGFWERGKFPTGLGGIWSRVYLLIG